jgi:hypothetical protein
MNRLTMIVLVFTIVLVGFPAEAQKTKAVGKKLLGDGAEAAAKTGGNPQSQVELISIPSDSALPIFYLTVEPAFVMAAQDIRSGGGVTPGAPDQSYFISDWLVATRIHQPQSLSPSAEPSERLGYGAAAQFTSVLTRVGNVAVIDYATYEAEPGRYPEIYIVRGTISELTETDGLDESSKGFDTKIPGRLLNIAGQLAGKSDLAKAGSVISQLNAGKKTRYTVRTGVVGLDIQLIRAATGQIVWSGPCQGTFTTRSATEIKHGLGFSKSEAEYQASALNQAARAALNQAALDLHSALKRQAVSQIAAAAP